MTPIASRDGILGRWSELQQIMKEHKVDRIVVALDDRRGKLPLGDLLSCKFKGVSITDSLDIQEELTGKIVTQGLYPSWLIFSDGFNRCRPLLLAKRIIDVALSGLLAIISLPIALLTAAAIKLESKGPILYTQMRVGEGDAPFKILKFRSMCHEAERECGAAWASAHDSRITKVGRVIRKLRIDELPQLYNILRGDMSFVGPRPERPEFVEDLKQQIPYYSQRFAVKPGLTGWAQVNYPYGASIEDAEEKLQYDLYYIKRLSLLLDLSIILRTAKVVLLGTGAR